mgnify:CR=1 FL=1
MQHLSNLLLNLADLIQNALLKLHGLLKCHRVENAALEDIPREGCFVLYQGVFDHRQFFLKLVNQLNYFRLLRLIHRLLFANEVDLAQHLRRYVLHSLLFDMEEKSHAFCK